MISAGFETTKAGSYWVALEGEKGAAIVRSHGVFSAPVDLTRAEALNWIRQEVWDLHSELKFDVATLKRAEAGRSVSNAVLERAEIDGVLMATLASRTIPVTGMAWTPLSKLAGWPNKESCLKAMRTHSIGSTLMVNRHTALAAAIAGMAS